MNELVLKKLDVGDLNYVTAGTLAYKKPVTTIDAATYDIESTESGTLYVYDRAAGSTITLPTAEVGMEFEFYIKTAVTGDSLIINADSSSDTLVGGVQIFDLSDKGSHTAMNEDVATIGWSQPAAADHQIVMDGATTTLTKGCAAGGYIKYTCVDAALWLVQGQLIGDGTLVTPFT